MMVGWLVTNLYTSPASSFDRLLLANDSGDLSAGNMEENLTVVNLQNTTHVVMLVEFSFFLCLLVTCVFFFMQQDDKLGKDTILDETEYPLQIFRDWPADRGKKQNMEINPHSLIHKVDNDNLMD